MPDGPHPVRIVFRYDDCSATSSLDLERRMVEAFARCRAQISLGVIPAVVEGSFRDRGPQRRLPVPADKAQWLREAAAAGHVEICLHGYSHQLASDTQLTEMAGRPEHEQETDLVKGKAELEALLGSPVTTFIPPWNSYDSGTVRALERSGFACLSASVRGPFDVNTSLQFLPFGCLFDGLKQVVPVARALRAAQPVIVVMMHDFDFIESGSKDAWLTVEDFGRQLLDLSRMPGVRLYSVRQACTDGAATSSPADLDPYRVWWKRIQGLSWTYRRLLANQVFWTGGGRSAPRRVWLRQSCVSAYCLWTQFVPALKRRLWAPLTTGRDRD